MTSALYEEAVMTLPADWPGDGPIDLLRHDLPHRSATTEWWYLNCHLRTTRGDDLSLFASFFRAAVAVDQQTGEPIFAHALNWALLDVGAGRYEADSLVDGCAPKVGLEKLERGEGPADPLLRRALRELLERGRVPLPDRLISETNRVSEDRLEIDLDSNRFFKLDDGAYRLQLQCPERGLGCDLTFHPLMEPIRHGDDGLVRGLAGEAMFYYFIPLCRVEGIVTLDDQRRSIAEGSGWYDHEFGCKEGDGEQAGAAWNWISAQLDDGTALTAFDIFSRDAGRERWAIFIDAAGERHQYEDFSFEPVETWTSTRTFSAYPVRWQLEIPDAGISLRVEAASAAQEFMTMISEPAFWEGRVNIHGTAGFREVSGRGFVERAGFETPATLGDFLGSAGQLTQQSVKALLPLEPSAEQARRLIASDEHNHYLAGLDIEQYARTVIRPLREMIDRGGKAWRSYALLACIDVVGGDSQRYTSWLAVPELLHTGSLIIDDIEDRSLIRRGGPACHHLYGEALAINAGNAAYFLGQILVHESNLSDAQKLKLYDLYFEALRAAHAGQAVDLDGLSGLVPMAIETGDGESLEERVLAVHRLKSAVPVRSLAMMGAIIGGGTPAQVGGLGDFFEAIGLAFQIMDDVLNLRGFEHDLKSRGEDISAGKVTMPVARALTRLAAESSRELWTMIASRPSDPLTVQTAIDLLESCGAIEACVDQAHELVDAAWQRLEPLIPDSQIKLTLRAFGWYVLDRTY